MSCGKRDSSALNSRRVDAAAQAARPDGMLEVQHLVVEQVLDGVARAGGTVEDAADDDGVVGGVVVAERALGVVLAPGEVGAAEQPAEKARVERVEDLLEIEEAALGPEVALAAARGADELRLARDGGRGGEALVAQVLRRRRWACDRAWREGCARWREGRIPGAPSRRSERLTKISPSRRRMVVLSEVKRRKRT